MKSSFSNARENKFYIVGIAIATTFFVVFFTSKLWLFDDSKVMQSPFGKEITGLEQTKLTLMKWEYNPEKELMELALGVRHSGDDVVKPTFTFSARERDMKEEYPVRVVYKDDENIVVQIENVPKKYQVVGLFVYEHRDKKILEAEVKERYASDQLYDELDEDEVEFTLPKPSETVVVGDYRKIKVNPSLVTRGAFEYQKENIQREIDGVDREMKLIVEEKIPMHEESIVALENDIESIKDELDYQVDEEKEESLARIEHNKESIERAKEEIEDYIELLEKHIKKKEKLLEKLENVSKENEGVDNDNIEKKDSSDGEKEVVEDESKKEKKPSKEDKKYKSKDKKDKNKDKKGD